MARLFPTLVKPETGGISGIMLILFVSFGGILFGYDTGTISGILAMKFWIKLFATTMNDQGEPFITAGQTSVIVSMLSVGTCVGALSGAPLGDYLGRRMGLIIATIIFIVGAIMQTVATAIPLFTAGRAVAGVGVGAISTLIPIYQSESAPKSLRGALIGCFQLFVTIGLLLASCVNNGTHQRNDTGSYRIPCAVQVGYALILFLGMLWLPETPRYLAKKDNIEGALKSLSRLRRLPQEHAIVQRELNEIIQNRDEEVTTEKGKWTDCFSRQNHNGRRLLTGCAIMAMGQFSGINFIFYFGTQFFEQAGINEPFTIALITNIVNVCSTIPGLVFVERWGRRPILLVGGIGIFVCQIIIAAVGLTTTSSTANNVLIAFVCFYIFFYAMCWGPVGWTVVGEIFPLQLRARSVSMSIFVIWLSNWAIAYATPYLVGTGPGDANLSYKVFFIWGGAAGLGTLFIYYYVFETKGLSLEQVDELYQTCTHAWNSNMARKTIRDRATAIERDENEVGVFQEKTRRPTAKHIEDSQIA